MKWFRNIFRRKEKQAPQPLRIDGVGEAPMTAEPDDAELAAQALLELMATHGDCPQREKSKTDYTGTVPSESDAPHDAKYFKTLASKIRTAQETARLRALRFVTFCEQELQRPNCQLSIINYQLMNHWETIEREGGDLKARWQHCLATVTVRLMQAEQKET